MLIHLTFRGHGEVYINKALKDFVNRAFNAKLLGLSKVGMIYKAIKCPELFDKILK